jgi:hypothetical protein
MAGKLEQSLVGHFCSSTLVWSFFLFRMELGDETTIILGTVCRIVPDCASDFRAA